MRDGCHWRSTSSASSPLAAVRTSHPSIARQSSSRSRLLASSSTPSTRLRIWGNPKLSAGSNYLVGPDEGVHHRLEGGRRAQHEHTGVAHLFRGRPGGERPGRVRLEAFALARGNVAGEE